MKNLSLFICLSILSFSAFDQQNSLCQGHCWSEDEANIKMKEFVSQWNNKESWEARAEKIRQGIIHGMQLEKMQKKRQSEYYTS